jgi:hypothetical protein
MNTIDLTTTTRVDHRLPAIAVIGALALIFAVIVAVAAESSVTSGGIFASMADYWAQVGEALGP